LFNQLIQFGALTNLSESEDNASKSRSTSDCSTWSNDQPSATLGF
jgi:hypothetical protein